MVPGAPRVEQREGFLVCFFYMPLAHRKGRKHKKGGHKWFCPGLVPRDVGRAHGEEGGVSGGANRRVGFCL